MVLITHDLLKKRSEHNDGVLSTLESITLHQFNIERIDPILHNSCKKLKILYLQNNLIEKLENLFKLKCLTYINLALNNIQLIEGLKDCESLQKIDLTLNFVSLQNLEQSVLNLKRNRNLRELHLMGNPCSDWKYYTHFIIYHLPFIHKIDSTQIKKSDRIFAKQHYHSLIKPSLKTAIDSELLKIVNKKRTLDDSNENATQTQIENEIQIENENENGNANGNGNGGDLDSYSIHTRKQMYLDDQKAEENEKRQDLENRENNRFREPRDLIKECHSKMSELVIIDDEHNDDADNIHNNHSQLSSHSLPKQRNLGRFEFRYLEESFDSYAKRINVIIECPKYLDSSQIIVDVHPLWFQIKIKQQLLLLHLPQEIVVNQSQIKRIQSTGWIQLLLPKLQYKEKAAVVVVHNRKHNKNGNQNQKEKRTNNTRRLNTSTSKHNEDSVDVDGHESQSDADFDDDSEVPPLE